MHDPIGKRLLGAATAVIAAVCAITGSLPAAQAAYREEEYLTWSQLDERWGDTPMGETTIRSSGCLVTALAMMIMDSGSLDAQAMENLGIESEEEFTPGVLADGYTSIGGFSTGGAINSWLDVQKLVPNVKWGYDTNFESTEKEEVAGTIKSLMSEGWYIIARVAAPYGRYHWVYIRGVYGDELYMSDPADSNPLLYEVYPDGLQGEFWALKGAVPPDTDFIPPETFEPFVKIDVVTPPKTLYAYGEPLDLSDCVVTVSGMDTTGMAWQNAPVPLTEAENVSVSTYTFSPERPGEYGIRLLTYTDYAFDEEIITLTVSQPVGEYYLDGHNQLDVYGSALGGAPIFTVDNGAVVSVTECVGDLGLIASDSFTGWIDVSRMSRVESSIRRIKGDINNDGITDKYDMSLLNTYLAQRETLPAGISTLTSDELSAADMNSDGKVDEADVIAYLTAL